MTQLKWIETFHSIVQADRHAFWNLYSNRVPCNRQLAEHPTVQVGQKMSGQHFNVGMLGVLNGFFEAEHPGYALALQLDGDEIVGVQVTNLTDMSGGHVMRVV